MLECYTIITGGGTGDRMNAAIPKQFLPLGKWTVIMRTMQQVAAVCDNIFVVLPESYFDFWKNLQQEYNFSIPHTLVKGGATRFSSVKNAMQFLPDTGLVAIHDAVRPLASKRFIQSAFYAANKHGNAVAALPVTDSLRMVDGDINKNVDRNLFYRMQTPQVFRCSEIKEAYQQYYQPHFTDDASVFEAFGGKIHLIKGEEQNIKMTKPLDLYLAESLINTNKNAKIKKIKNNVNVWI